MRKTKRARTIGATACAAALALAAPAGAALSVWVIQDTDRALRDDPPGPARTATLGAARNEWVSFQILMRADAPVREIELEPGDLLGPDRATLRGADAVLYRQHQIRIDEPSHRNDRFRPGWYPDPLIPFRHPLTGAPLRGARLSAVPFDLPANETHGFLVDRKIPRDAPAGEYRGRCRVTAPGIAPVDVEVRLVVWDFALPDTPTLKTALGSPAERMRRYHSTRAGAGGEPEAADWAAVETQCAALLRDHRINATPPAEMLRARAGADGSFAFDPAQVDGLRRFIDTYAVNAIRTPHPSSVVKDPDRDRDRLRAWLASFDRLAARLDRPAVTLYTYLKDEPNDAEAYRYVQRWGSAVRSARSVLKVLVVEQTKTQSPAWGDLYGAVDIWCPLFPLHDEASAARRGALGEEIWTYTALCQRDPTPWWQIDFPLLNYRVPLWIAWRHNMNGLLYWGGMSHWSGVDDPWSDPKTLDRRRNGKGPLYQGEGTLVYPACAVGYDGIAPSLRLKALRDGIEDFEYLALLERAGAGEQARAVVLPLASSWFKWERAPAAYRVARAKLASMLVDATRAGERR